MTSSICRICLKTIFLYSIISLSVEILNKLLFNRGHFYLINLLMLWQTACGFIILQVASWCHLTKNKKIHPIHLIRPRNDSLILTSILYCLQCWLSMKAFSEMNVPTYRAVKACVPLLIMTFQKSPENNDNHKRSYCFWAIACGAMISCLYDFGFDERSYVYGVLGAIVQACYLINIEKLGDEKREEERSSPLEAFYIQNFYSMIFFGSMTLISGEYGELHPVIYSVHLYRILFVTTLIGGNLLTYLILCSAILNSALTTSVVGNFKSTFQLLVSYTIGGYAFYIIEPTVTFVIGTILCVSGCILYTKVIVMP